MPSVCGRPSMRFMFSIACPAAPLTRLSRHEETTSRPARRSMLGWTKQKLLPVVCFVCGGRSTTRVNGASAKSHDTARALPPPARGRGGRSVDRHNRYFRCRGSSVPGAARTSRGARAPLPGRAAPARFRADAGDHSVRRRKNLRLPRRSGTPSPGRGPHPRYRICCRRRCQHR